MDTPSGVIEQPGAPRRSNARRLLFLTDVAPLPVDRGQRVRLSMLLGGCGRVFSVTFVGPAPAEANDREAFERSCERVVWVERVRDREAGIRAWLHAARAAPGIKRWATIRRFLPYAAALGRLDLDAFDLFWAERPHMARLCQKVRERTILDFDDLAHRRTLQELQLQHARRPFHLPVDELYRYALYRWLELSWSKSFLATVVCSEDERRYLAERGCPNVVVVPNAVNDQATASDEAAARRPRRTPQPPLRMAFLGNLGHLPNLDAIDYFVKEVFPLLRDAYPSIVFDVVGPSAEPTLQARYAGHVRFRGFVADLGAALADYDVFVAPIRFGSGTRVKLLDAMACGIPIVTTRVGAEGLPVRDGDHLLFGDTAPAFAERVLAIKRQPSLGERLAENARQLVDREFRSATIQDRVAAWLGTLVPEGESAAER